MARSNLVLTLTLIFFSFIVFSHAYHPFPLDFPNDDSTVFPDHPSLTLPEPGLKKTILLPSEKPESEPATVVDLNHHDDDEAVPVHLNEVVLLDDEIVEEKESSVEDPEISDPNEEGNNKVVFLDLRPDVRRRFPDGIRRPHHRCHHPRPRHHRHEFGHVEEGRREVSYGNDMLVEKHSGRVEEEKEEVDAERFDRVGHHHGPGGPGRWAPSRWFNFHFGGKPRFEFDLEHEHHHHHRHHHHDHDEEDHHHDDHDDEDHHHEDRRPDDHRGRDREEEEPHNHHHEHDYGLHRHHDDRGEEMWMKRPFGQERREGGGGGGLMKRVRKFLHQLEL